MCSILWMLKQFPPGVARWLWLSLLLHLITAHFSVGYYHPDEHFQILEFIGYKLGLSPATDLPWEFEARIRPWFQPAVMTAFVKGFRLLGIQNAVVWSELFRQISGLLSWISVLALVWRSKDWFKNELHRWERIAFLFGVTWFLPFVHVRTSSESWSSSFFFIGLALLTSPRLTLLGSAAAGAFIAAAFEARFQSGFLIFGLFCWCVARRRLDLLQWVAALTSFLTVFAVGRCLDRWGYGVWTFTPWNYLHANIFENKAAQWGTDPWWGYFYLIGKLLPPLSLLALLAIIGAWVKRPWHPLTWATVPFFAIHCWVAHKEARFLIPLFWALPVFLEFWRKTGSLTDRFLHSRMGSILGRLLLVINLGALAVLTFAPARTEFKYLEHVYNHYPQGLTVYWQEEEPVRLAGGLKANFLIRPQSQTLHTDNLESLAASNRDEFYFFDTRRELLAQIPALSSRCQRVFSSISDTEARWLPAKTLKKIRVMNLFKCPPAV
jgi:GPI mannosyltransferase 3